MDIVSLVEGLNREQLAALLPSIPNEYSMHQEAFQYQPASTRIVTMDVKMTMNGILGAICNYKRPPCYPKIERKESFPN